MLREKFNVVMVIVVCMLFVGVNVFAKTCPKCKAELKEKAKFCDECGEKFTDDQKKSSVKPTTSSTTKSIKSGYKKWLQHKENLKNDSSVERYYTFEDGGLEVKNNVGEKGTLSFKDINAKAGEPTSGEIVQVDGRWPEKKAIQLDTCSFVGEPYDVKNKNFTFECWFRKNGPGTLRGMNNAKSGTLIVGAQSGYYEGWRIVSNMDKTDKDAPISFFFGGMEKASWTDKLVHFGVESGPVTDEVWHHLVITWDGKTINMYIDGDNVTSKECSKNYVPSSWGNMLIGYGSGGVGSMVLDIDEMVIYNRPLSAEEVKEHSLIK